MISAFLPHPRAVNAAGIVIHGQYAALSRRHDVTLLSFAGPDPTDRDAVDSLRAAGVEIRTVWRHPPRGLSRQRLRMAASWIAGQEPLRNLRFDDQRMHQAIGEAMSRTRPDVVQVEDIAMAAYSYRGPHATVLTEHEVRTEINAVPSSPSASPLWRAMRAVDVRRWRTIQPRRWARFDRIQVYTPRDAADIARLAPDLEARVRVNPFGIDLPPASTYASEERDLLVFIGGFLHEPNVDAALWLARDIFPLVRARRPGARLVLVGSYPPRDVCALASSDIVVTGRVDDVQPFVERAAVVLAPIRAGGGLRLKVLQAMAYGKAIVCTPLAAEGIREPHRGAMLGHDAHSLADAATELLEDDGRRRELGERARSLVASEHSWSAYADRWDTMYGELRRGALARERQLS